MCSLLIHLQLLWHHTVKCISSNNIFKGNFFIFLFGEEFNILVLTFSPKAIFCLLKFVSLDVFCLKEELHNFQIILAFTRLGKRIQTEILLHQVQKIIGWYLLLEY